MDLLKPTLFACSLFAAAGFLRAEGPDIAAWSVTVKGGPAFPVFGDFTGSSAEAATTTENDGGETVTTGNNASINSLSWDDAFDDFLSLAVEVDFWETDTRSFYVGVSRTQADGKSVLMGTFNGQGVTARFSDYTDTGLYAGFRFGVGQASWIKSLLSLQLGATWIENIDATTTNLPNADKIGIYKATTVFSAGAFLSVIATPLDFLEIGVEAGFEYQTAPDGDNSQLGILGLNGVNSEGELGLVPVRVLATIKF